MLDLEIVGSIALSVAVAHMQLKELAISPGRSKIIYHVHYIRVMRWGEKSKIPIREFPGHE